MYNINYSVRLFRGYTCNRRRSDNEFPGFTCTYVVCLSSVLFPKVVLGHGTALKQITLIQLYTKFQ